MIMELAVGGMIMIRFMGFFFFFPVQNFVLVHEIRHDEVMRENELNEYNRTQCRKILAQANINIFQKMC